MISYLTAFLPVLLNLHIEKPTTFQNRQDFYKFHIRCHFTRDLEFLQGPSREELISATISSKKDECILEFLHTDKMT